MICGATIFPIYQGEQLVGVEMLGGRMYYGDSLGVFTPHNSLRLAAIIIADNKWFEAFVLLAVIANCLFLAAQVRCD